jgi:hypothetical protein
MSAKGLKPTSAILNGFTPHVFALRTFKGPLILIQIYGLYLLQPHSATALWASWQR